MARIIIIGAGLSGLSVVYHLEKKGFTDYRIVEKESGFGGLCRSFKQDGFIFDCTGHLLHSNDSYFSAFLYQLFDENELNTLVRNSWIYSNEMYTPYPYQTNLHGLPLETVLDCIEGYVNRKHAIRKPKLFSEWVLKFFGLGFAKSFFFPYQRKLLQFDPKKLSASWTGRFVPQTSLRELLIGALQRNEKKQGYNATFLYPRAGGIQSLIDHISRKVEKRIVVNCAVTNINLTQKIISYTDGSSEHYDILVNTMPLDQLLKIIQDRSSTHFTRATKELLCTSVMCLNLGLSRQFGFDMHWIYYPEKQYPFYRVGFYNNFSSAMVPPDSSSLYVECSYRSKSGQSIAKLVKSVRKEIKSLFCFSDSEIITEQLLNISHAYVIYDRWREHNLAKLLGRLEQEDIYSIGRYGAWKYASMQEAVLDSRAIVEKILFKPAKRIISVQKKVKQKKASRIRYEKETY